MSKTFFLFAGEKSGDLLGRALLKTFKKQFPDRSFFGVGGPEMRTEGMKCLLRTEEFEIIGFSDILRSLPRLRKQFQIIRDHILKTKPEVVLFIDYPGFNLRMAKSLRKQGYKGRLVQYISPTVWAWGKHRIQKMADTLDLLMTIYPFENAHYSRTSLNVKYVGNPIKEIISEHHYDDDWHKLFGIKDPKNLIALFPGSRKGEIQLNLPYQLKAAALLKQENPDLCFAISCAHDKIMPIIHYILKDIPLKFNKDIFLLPKSYAYELMRDCRSAIAKSGTVTLELALHRCPTVVIYKLTLLNRLIAQYVLRLNLPHYCIVNILCGKTVFPEIIEKGLTPKAIVTELRKLTEDTEERKTCLHECERLPSILLENNASEHVSNAIKELIS